MAKGDATTTPPLSCPARVRALRTTFSAQLFAFTNRRRDRARILAWERNGFVLWMKRLERERFHWPRGDTAVVTLSGQELNWLLDGYDLSKWHPHSRLHYEWVA